MLVVYGMSDDILWLNHKLTILLGAQIPNPSLLHQNSPRLRYIITYRQMDRIRTVSI